MTKKTIVDILNHNLTREGYDTVQAYDGEQALDVASEQKPWFDFTWCNVT